MNFSFDSVDSFLQQAVKAKQGQRDAIDKGLEPLLDDPATFAILPDLVDLIDRDLEAYGDESLKQVAAVAIGKWVQLHQDWLQQHIEHEAAPEAAMTAADMTKLVQAVKLVEEVGSFGGDEDYRKAAKQQINQAILEKLEDQGGDANEVFSRYDDPLL